MPENSPGWPAGLITLGCSNDFCLRNSSSLEASTYSRLTSVSIKTSSTEGSSIASATSDGMFMRRLAMLT